MRAHWLSLFAVSFLCNSAAALPEVLLRLITRDDAAKYFTEPGTDDILGHYDVRFFDGVVSHEERTETLTHMTRAYLEYFRDNGMETWIAHGTLLGWWWNGKILPWDWDVDTQVSGPTLMELGDNHNQTVHKYTPPGGNTTREYLLDVNRWSRERERGNGRNIIDARWIDTSNGLFIDITGISELNPETEPGILGCKNYHRYKTTDIYSLRQSVFEGVPALIPYKYTDILLKEYNNKAVSKKDYEK